MTRIFSELGPISDAATQNIRVEVLSRYSAENSKPQQELWVFEYTVRISNGGAESVQLLSRHWLISDGMDQVKEVNGPGVVSKQPVVEPGESFKYSSWCQLKTPTGVMRGTYQMQRVDGSLFDIEIAPFALKAPYTVH